MQCSRCFYGWHKTIKQMKHKTKAQIKIYKSRILKSKIQKEKQLIHCLKKSLPIEADYSFQTGLNCLVFVFFKISFYFIFTSAISVASWVKLGLSLGLQTQHFLMTAYSSWGQSGGFSRRSPSRSTRHRIWIQQRG